MKTKLLKQVAVEILARPEQIYMGTWFGTRDGIPDCGTEACIGGWALTLAVKANKKKPLRAAKKLTKDFGNADSGFGSYQIGGGTDSNVCQKAKKALGLTQPQAVRLFFLPHWPAQFRTELNAAPRGTMDYAKVVHDRITHFIATKGKE